MNPPRIPTPLRQQPSPPLLHNPELPEALGSEARAFIAGRTPC